MPGPVFYKKFIQGERGCKVNPGCWTGLRKSITKECIYKGNGCMFDKSKGRAEVKDSNNPNSKGNGECVACYHARYKQHGYIEDLCQGKACVATRGWYCTPCTPGKSSPRKGQHGQGKRTTSAASADPWKVKALETYPWSLPTSCQPPYVHDAMIGEVMAHFNFQFFQMMQDSAQQFYQQSSQYILEELLQLKQTVDVLLAARETNVKDVGGQQGTNDADGKHETQDAVGQQETKDADDP